MPLWLDVLPGLEPDVAAVYPLEITDADKNAHAFVSLPRRRHAIQPEM